MAIICSNANKCQTRMHQGLWIGCGLASFTAECVARGPSFPRRRIGANSSEVVHALGAVFLPLPLVGEGWGETDAAPRCRLAPWNRLACAARLLFPRRRIRVNLRFFPLPFTGEGQGRGAGRRPAGRIRKRRRKTSAPRPAAGPLPNPLPPVGEGEKPRQARAQLRLS